MSTITTRDALAASASRAADAAPPAYRRPRMGGVLRKAIAYAVLIAGAILLLTPFFWLVSSSLKTDQEISNLSQWLPTVPQWGNYYESLQRMGLEVNGWFISFPALANTIVVTVVSVVGQVLSCSLAGYGFARYRFPGKNKAFAVMLATMMLPPQVTMIPTFLLFRQLGMIDSLLPLVIPAFFGSPFFIFMFRQFFAQVPESLLEAARIDGASHLQVYARIMLPLSKPVIAITAIYTFMFAWNDFLGPLIYLNSPEMRTLALELNAFSGQYGVESRELLMAASFITMLPCIVLFFAAQRYFMDTGATSGMKG
ncbi:MAG: carbohydrate ABC transporter permease [Planctomycetota bacterium]